MSRQAFVKMAYQRQSRRETPVNRPPCILAASIEAYKGCDSPLITSAGDVTEADGVLAVAMVGKRDVEGREGQVMCKEEGRSARVWHAAPACVI
jgi:hypothetical protein